MCIKRKFKEYVKNEDFIGLKDSNCYSVGQINLFCVCVCVCVGGGGGGGWVKT